MTPPVPASIFKAYDVRGLYPSELDEAVAEHIGFALAQQLEQLGLVAAKPSAANRFARTLPANTKHVHSP